MQTFLSPAEYFAPGSLAREQQRLFQRAWCFVGLARDVAQPEQWITAEVGGRSVTVQNCDGVLRAFHNVCSHRFSIMRQEPCGHGPLRCPYHGWLYGDDGVPSAIPARPRFADLTPARVAALALERFRVERCGQFLFVRVAPGGRGLREYLGDEAWSALEEISDALQDCLADREVTIQANWKLVVENSLESYHTGLVHPETLGKIRSSRFHIHAADRYCRFVEHASEAALANWRRVEKAFASRPLRNTDYVHHFVFPNFALDAMRGATFILAVVRPLSDTACAFRTRIFSTRLADDQAAGAVVRAYHGYAVAFLDKVVEEDRGAVEAVARGVREVQQPGILSEEEIRVGAFQRNCRAFLDDDEPATDLAAADLPIRDYHSTPSLSRGPGLPSA